MLFVGRTWSHHLSHALHGAAIERAMSRNKIMAIPSITCSSLLFLSFYCVFILCVFFFSFIHFQVCVQSGYLIVSDAPMLLMLFVLVWCFVITLHILRTKFGTKIFWKMGNQFNIQQTRSIHEALHCGKDNLKVTWVCCLVNDIHDDCHLLCAVHT